MKVPLLRTEIPIIKITKLLSCAFVVICLLSSCGSSKAAKEMLTSYEYKMKKVHMENVNSSYDDLVEDYLESQKSLDQKEEEAFARDTMAYMSKSACLGRCPVYRLTLYNNGNVKYEGVANVDLVGIYESKLEIEQHKKVKELLSKVEFLKLPHTFPRGVTIVADAAVKKMVLTNGELKFRYTINYGEPEELTKIELYLDQLVGELAWVQI